MMAEPSIDLLLRAMTAFLQEDEQVARALIQEDDGIDEWYRRLYDKAVQSALGDARNIERAEYVIWAAHNLERLGGRVGNICEQVIYVATGEHPNGEGVRPDSIPFV